MPDLTVLSLLLTRTVTDSTTAVTTLPFNPSVDKTKTIEILQPIPTTTITTSYVGVTTSYLTKTAQLVKQLLLLLMCHIIPTTVTSKWTGTITTTTTRTNPTDSIDTVVVQVPLQIQLQLQPSFGQSHLLVLLQSPTL